MIIEELSREGCLEALQHAGFGRLGCAFGSQPYVVPIHFRIDGRHAYSFSMPGQKVEWMRKNPLVCLEIDEVTHREDWTSVIALGRYEELPDTEESRPDRRRALELLQESAMWWQPGSVPLLRDINEPAERLVLYRIAIERLSGHRGRPAADFSTSASRVGWLGRLLHNFGPRP